MIATIAFAAALACDGAVQVPYGSRYISIEPPTPGKSVCL